MLDMQGENIQHFDYGPYPFGGWSYMQLQPGMVLVKKFSSVNVSGFIQIGIMLASVEPVEIEFLVNGVPCRFSFPEIPPNKSDRRMVAVMIPVVDGMVEFRVKSVSGGAVYALYDRQRRYERSALNGEFLAGEWIMRAIVPR